MPSVPDGSGRAPGGHVNATVSPCMGRRGRPAHTGGGQRDGPDPRPVSHVLLAVTVRPSAQQTADLSVDSDWAQFSLAAPPVDGAANTELISYLARVLKVS